MAKPGAQFDPSDPIFGADYIVAGVGPALPRRLEAAFATVKAMEQAGPTFTPPDGLQNISAQILNASIINSKHDVSQAASVTRLRAFGNVCGLATGHQAFGRLHCRGDFAYLRSRRAI
jgi:hypothetical protein